MPRLAKAPNALNVKNSGPKTGRIDVSGEIGFSWYGDSYDAASFSQALKDLGDVSLIEVHINSPGGSVFDGIAMYNALVQHPAVVHTYVDGIAASIASVLAMAGDKVFMPSNTMLFIHDPWMYTAGNAEELRKDANALDQMKTAIVNSYMRHVKSTSDSISALMKSETWLTASEATATFNNVEVLQQQKEALALNLKGLGSIPKQAKAFLYEEDENIIDKAVKFLNRRGFNKAADAVRQELLARIDNEETTEESMTPEETTALKNEIKAETVAAVAPAVTEAVNAALIAAKVIPDPKAKADEPEKIPFEGDPSKPEDVEAHLNKINAAKAAKILASGDEKAITEYLASIKPSASPAKPVKNLQPAGNASPGTGKEDPDKAQKAQDVKDTTDAMLARMPTK